jgi:hypothetical protein
VHVNPSHKFVRMQMETKGSHARMDVGVEAGRLVWSGGAGGGWGFHHIFGSPGFPIALLYIYCIL